MNTTLAAKNLAHQTHEWELKLDGQAHIRVKANTKGEARAVIKETYGLSCLKPGLVLTKIY